MFFNQDANLLGDPAPNVARDVLEQLPERSLRCLDCPA
jgi:hypothetical protein